MKSSKTASSLERRLSRMVAAICVCCAAIYIFAPFFDYEDNFLVFITNVFSPALLVIFGAATFAGEIYAYARKRSPHPPERLVRYSLVIAMLLPCLAGEIRSHERPKSLTISPKTEISVLDVNLLGPRNVSKGFYEEVARLQPDVIILQELNPIVAQTLVTRFGHYYPCQHLEAHTGVVGMGILAKFPCAKRDSSGFLAGIGVPQIVDVQLPSGKTIGVINVHTIPPQTLIKYNSHDNEIQQLSNAVVSRELFVKSMIEHSRVVSTDAVILAGDFNATARNRVYRIVREMGLYDAFAVGSRLRGGTWPGPDFPLPSWLVRIDFIFHCAGLRALRAETLPEGYGSDHRGVFATLALVE